MAEIKNFQVLPVVTGTAELGFGLVIFEACSRVREFIRVPNPDPNQFILNTGKYDALVSHFSENLVNGVINYGYDLGWALGFIGISEMLRGSVFRNEPVLQDLWNFAVVGLLGGQAMIGELYTFGVLLTQGGCSKLGCGDVVDLAIFTGMTAYPFVVRRMRQQRAD